MYFLLLQVLHSTGSRAYLVGIQLDPSVFKRYSDLNLYPLRTKAIIPPAFRWDVAFYYFYFFFTSLLFLFFYSFINLFFFYFYFNFLFYFYLFLIFVFYIYLIYLISLLLIFFFILPLFLIPIYSIPKYSLYVCSLSIRPSFLISSTLLATVCINWWSCDVNIRLPVNFFIPSFKDVIASISK